MQVIIEDIVAMVEKLPPEVLDAVGRIVSALLSHDDPARAAERAAAAIASETAADALIHKELEG